MKQNMRSDVWKSLKVRGEKRAFIISFVILLLLFCLVEIFCFYMPERRTIQKFEGDVKNDLQTSVGDIFTWAEDLQAQMADSAEWEQEDIRGWLFDGVGVFRGPWSIKGILYTSDGGGAFGYWNLEADMRNSFILDYITDFSQSAMDGQRWVQLDEDDVKAICMNIEAAEYVSDDIQSAKTNMEPALCGVGSVHAMKGFKGFVAYVPVKESGGTLMAVIEENALTDLPAFQRMAGEGYGYTLSKDAISFSIALATGPDTMAREKGDYEIELPGCIWNLNIYPLNSVISVYRILLEIVISGLGAWIIAYKVNSKAVR